LLTGAIAAFAVGPVVLAGSGADYVSARNAIVALVPGAVCLSAGYAASRAGLVAASALCTLSLAIALSVSLDTKYGRTDWRGLAATIGPATTERALVVTPDIDAALWRIYLPMLQEFGDRPVRVREIVVAGLARRRLLGWESQTAPGDAQEGPAGFTLLEARLSPTFALIRIDPWEPGRAALSAAVGRARSCSWRVRSARPAT